MQPIFTDMNRITVTTDVDAGRVSRHLYGHFAEHLGRCIYDGIWVGEDSPMWVASALTSSKR